MSRGATNPATFRNRSVDASQGQAEWAHRPNLAPGASPGGNGPCGGALRRLIPPASMTASSSKNDSIFLRLALLH
jgi:hypothetical protein